MTFPEIPSPAPSLIPSLVPELLVSALPASIEFWCELCGFTVDHRREAEGFALISRGNAQVMLEQEGVGRNWITGPLDRPLGRGISFQIVVPELTPILSTLEQAGQRLFMAPETRWYRIGDEEAGVGQFLVEDPDGYLLRFQSSIGRRPFGSGEIGSSRRPDPPLLQS